MHYLKSHLVLNLVDFDTLNLIIYGISSISLSRDHHCNFPKNCVTDTNVNARALFSWPSARIVRPHLAIDIHLTDNIFEIVTFY